MQAADKLFSARWHALRALERSVVSGQPLCHDRSSWHVGTPPGRDCASLRKDQDRVGWLVFMSMKPPRLNNTSCA